MMKPVFYNGRYFRGKQPVCDWCGKLIELRDEVVNCRECGVPIHKRCSVNDLCNDCYNEEMDRE